MHKCRNKNTQKQYNELPAPVQRLRGCPATGTVQALTTAVMPSNFESHADSGAELLEVKETKNVFYFIL